MSELVYMPDNICFEGVSCVERGYSVEYRQANPNELVRVLKHSNRSEEGKIKKVTHVNSSNKFAHYSDLSGGDTGSYEVLVPTGNFRINVNSWESSDLKDEIEKYDSISLSLCINK